MAEKGGYFHVVNDSSYNPFNLVYKLGEEFEVPMPTGESTKCVETGCGNVFTMLQKTAKGTVKMVTTVTSNFMLQDIFVLGTNTRAKIIFQKCC